MNRAQRLLVVSLCVLGAVFFSSVWYVMPLVRYYGEAKQWKEQMGQWNEKRRQHYRDLIWREKEGAKQFEYFQFTDSMFAATSKGWRSRHPLGALESYMEWERSRPTLDSLPPAPPVPRRPESHTENILLGIVAPVVLLGGATFVLLGAKKGPPSP